MWLWQNKSDEEVLDLIRQGNEEALKYLYRQNYSMVRKYVIDNSGSLQDVDDMLQDGVIAVWKNVSKSDFVLKSKLTTYFMAIVKNLWLKKIRKNKKVDTVDDETLQFASASVEQNTSRQMDLNVVRNLLNEIGDTCKELLGLFYFEQMDNISIAERMDFSNPDVVKAKKYQCLKKLKVIFYERYTESDFKG
jgi:RNA polymerase sigma factor (sigma-70 family)